MNPPASLVGPQHAALVRGALVAVQIRGLVIGGLRRFARDRSRDAVGSHYARSRLSAREGALRGPAIRYLDDCGFVDSSILLCRHRPNGSGEAVGPAGLLCRSWTRFVSAGQLGLSMDGPAAYLQALCRNRVHWPSSSADLNDKRAEYSSLDDAHCIRRFFANDGADALNANSCEYRCPHCNRGG